MTTAESPVRPEPIGLREAVAAPVLLPGEDGWDAARAPWNVAVDQRPVAVALPGTAEQVAEVVRFAASEGLRVLPQGSGHGAAPMGDLAGTILVRTTGMRAVRIDPEARIARAEAGAVWDDVIPLAAEHGLTALHGSSPSVGVAGYSLGGGIGWMARRHGLAGNAVTAVELVTGAGEIVRADAENHPELFWGLRGGGGNLGVVTAVEFRLFPLDEAYAGWLVWPWERTGDVLAAWSEWTRGLPEEVTSVARVLQLPPIPEIPEPLRGRSIAVVEAAVVGDDLSGAPALLEPLRALGPEMDTFAVVPALALTRLHQDPEAPTPGVCDQVMLDALPPEAVDALAGLVGPGSGSPLLSVEIRNLGGALARPAEGGGALSHLDGAFALFGIGVPMDPAMGAAIDAHLDRVRDGLAPWGRGRTYVNFGERPFTAESAHDPATIARLRAVRDRYDPRGVIRGRFAIPEG